MGRLNTVLSPFSTTGVDKQRESCSVDDRWSDGPMVGWSDGARGQAVFNGSRRWLSPSHSSAVHGVTFLSLLPRLPARAPTVRYGGVATPPYRRRSRRQALTSREQESSAVGHRCSDGRMFRWCSQPSQSQQKSPLAPSEPLDSGPRSRFFSCCYHASR